MRQTQTVLHETRDVVIRPLVTNRDPRLLEIDLRGRGRVITVRVLSLREGPAPVDPLVLVRPRGASEVQLSPVDGRRGPQHPFFLQASSADLRVHADGYRPQEIDGVRDDTTIHLEAGIPVRIFDPRSLRRPGYRLAARLSREGMPEWAPHPFEHPGGAYFRLPGPGTYRLELFVEERNTGRTLPVVLPEGSVPITIEVLEATEEQVFDIAPPMEVLLDAVERLKEGG